MKALILAAGQGKRLLPYTAETPKAFLQVNGKPILYHIIDRLISNKIKDIVVVVGFRKDRMISNLLRDYPDVNFEFVVNERFSTTNTLYSMWLARDFINDEFLYMHGDILFNCNLIKKLLNPQYKNAALVSEFKENMHAYGENGIITRISKQTPIIGKAIGIYKFSKEARDMLFAEADNIIRSGAVNVFQSEAVNPTIKTHKMHCVLAPYTSWAEIDDYEELLAAQEKMKQIEKDEQTETNEVYH